MYEVKEEDWKLYRAKLPEWQEKYMEKLTREYVQLLTGDKSSSQKWWELENRIRKDRKSSGVFIDDLRRSRMQLQLQVLLYEHVIGPADLEGFSDELKDHLYWTHI